MMKNLLLILISLLLFSCGARKSEVEKREETEKRVEKTDFEETKTEESKSKSTTDLAKHLSELGFSVKSDGSPYKLSFGGLIFEGSANLDFKKKDEAVTQKTIVNTWNKIATHTRFITNITYQTHTTFKSKITDKKAYPIWIYLVLGSILTILIQILLKNLKPYQWLKNAIFKSKNLES